MVDVTWRYSVNRREVSERRASMLNEDWLADTLEELNRTTSVAITPARRVSSFAKHALTRSRFF